MDNLLEVSSYILLGLLVAYITYFSFSINKNLKDGINDIGKSK